ncbi:MAG: DUF6781 family protein [Pseudomonadota bacterium]
MSELSNEAIKEAASASVSEGNDIRSRVYSLTLNALKQRKLESAEVREVVKSLTEGISIGAEKRAADSKQALGEAFAGLDDAMKKSAEAFHLALEQLTASGKEFNDGDLKIALDNLKQTEEAFMSTVQHVSESAGERIRAEWRDLLTHARHTGTDTGRQVASTLGAFSNHARSVTHDAQTNGLSAAREFGARLTLAASGILAGIADALHEPKK